MFKANDPPKRNPITSAVPQKRRIPPGQQARGGSRARSTDALGIRGFIIMPDMFFSGRGHRGLVRSDTLNEDNLD